MVLNNNNFLSDGDFFADEEEWEFLNNDDSTSVAVEVAEQSPIAAPAVDLERAESKDVPSADSISNREKFVAPEANMENRQDESESNISGDTSGRTRNGSSEKEEPPETEEHPLIEANSNNLNDLEMKEETASLMSDDVNNNLHEDEPPSSHTQHRTKAPLQNAWNFIGDTFHDIDNQHQLRQRTRNSVLHINRSAQDIWSSITNETKRVRDQANVHARNASSHVCTTASSAKESICRANTEYKLSEKVATVAVIGGATLLVLGNPRAGFSALAVAGASIAAGEVLHSNNEDSNRNRDHGLREGVHLD